MTRNKKIVVMYFPVLLTAVVLYGFILYGKAMADNGPDRPWVKDVIYFALIDRFLDEDPSNNVPRGCDPGLFDLERKNLNLYHGGDLAGLMRALEDNYFSELGVTAIWISPPVKNAWWSTPENKSGYHGYWTQDFLDIDPHLTSTADGYDCQSRRRRLEEYKAFIDLAHKKGIKVIQDIVVNHIGPLFYYDVNNNGRFDKNLKINEKYVEWIQPYKEHGYYDRVRWVQEPQWNLYLTQPGVIPGCEEQCLNVKTKGVLQRLFIYSRKGFSQENLGQNNGEEIKCDFVANRDIWTNPSSCFFDDLVDEFVEIYSFYLSLGIDGFRVDTVRHVDHVFWDQFITRVKDRLSEEARRKILIFGEVYSGKPGEVGRYTYRSDWQENSSPLFDSLLNFQFCFAVRDFLRIKDNVYGSPQALLDMIDDLNYGREKDSNRYYFNRRPGEDDLCSRQKMINFIGNHDGLNRFLVNGVKERNNRLALGLAMTMEGIPCVYYGSECDLRGGGEIGENSEKGRVSFLKTRSDNSADSDQRLTMDEAKHSPTYRFIKKLSDYRQELASLQYGRVKALYPEKSGNNNSDPVFIFLRYLEKQYTSGKEQSPVIVAINAHPIDTIKVNGLKLVDIYGGIIDFPAQAFVRALSMDEGAPVGQASLRRDDGGLIEIDLELPPQSMSLFLIKENS